MRLWFKTRAGRACRRSYECNCDCGCCACREKRLLALIQKQDRLLYLCFYMLLNLSEDVGVERKMKKKVRARKQLGWAS